MKRKMAILSALGALVALAVPASSSAWMSPAYNSWELVGGGNPPKLGNSLGSCPVTKITGKVPAPPANEAAVVPSPVTLTVGTCSSGTTLTLAGETKMSQNGYLVPINIPEVTMKFSSLPGCKLQGPLNLMGFWMNGSSNTWSGYFTSKSGYRAMQTLGALTWQDDGATCASAGKTETMTWTQSGLAYSTVNNLTAPNFPISVG